MLQLTETTDAHYIFRDSETGAKHVVGRDGYATPELALGAVLNPPAEVLPYCAPDNIPSVRLGVADTDKQAFHELLTLLNESLAAGAKQLTDTIIVRDVSGALHTITIAEYKLAMLYYGNYHYEQKLLSWQ